MSAIVIGSFIFPVPSTNLELFWLLLGMQFGRSFGKKLDQGIQAGTTFNNLPEWVRGVVKRLLDFMHHWQYGGVIWLYATEIALALGLPNRVPEILFFGLGLMVDDIRDVENLKRRYGLESAKPPT